MNNINKKNLIVGIFFVVLSTVFLKAPQVKALTSDEIRVLIQQLQQQIVWLQNQLKEQEGQTITACHTSSLWSWDYCSFNCKCNAGEGDCDSDLQCSTGYCALDVGAKYGKSSTIDICEEKQTTEVAEADDGVKSLDILSPNGGETLETGKTYEIKWAASGLLVVNIDIFDYSSSSTTKIAENASAANGSYFWTIPSSFAVGDKYKIILTDQKIQDESNDYFGIISTPNQSPTTPTVGPSPVATSGKVGESIKYVFSSRDPAGGDKYSLIYMINWGDGTTQTCVGYYIKGVKEPDCTINRVWPRAGTYNVSVKTKDNQGAESEYAYLSVAIVSIAPTCADSDGGQNYYLKGKTVGWASGDILSTNTDYCIANTLIEGFCSGSVYQKNTDYICAYGCQDGACKPAITVTSPNGEEELTVGDVYNITWSSGGVNKVNIELRTSSGGRKIASNLPSSQGVFNWKVDMISNKSTSYKIRITDASQSTVFDESGNYFTIIPATPASCTYLSEGLKDVLGAACGEAKYNSVYDLNKDKYIDEKDSVLIVDKIKDEAWCNAMKADNTNPCGVVCTDSDGGKDYYKKGIATGLNTVDLITTRTDECVGTTGQELGEFYCYNSYIGSEVYKCPFGCQDGACLIEAPK